jgi:hypothetical protein
LNTSADEDFHRSISQWLNVEKFLKFIITENFLGDQLSQGLLVYHQAPASISGNERGWLFIEDSFENRLLAKSVSYGSRGVSELSPAKDLFSALSSRLMEIPSLHRLYIELYIQFLSVTFGMAMNGESSMQDPAVRFKALFDFLQPWVEKDKFWQITYGSSPSKLQNSSLQTVKELGLRYKVVTAELIKAAQDL